VLTGDTLFVGDIARPDLAVDKQEGARDIFRSLHDKLLSLPCNVEVWPGHLGGSLCGGPGMDMKVSSTIGFEREHNDMLQEADQERFVERAIRGLPPQPPNFQAVVDINRGPLQRDALEPHPLTPRQVEVKQRAGALVVDVRTALQFDEAHIPASVSNPAVQAGFGTKLAWIAEREQEVVFVGRDAEDGIRAAHLAGSVGITNVGGYLEGGMTSWREERRTTSRVGRVDVPGLRGLTERDSTVQVLDVREAAEWEEGHIRGSVHTPYHDVRSVPAGLDPGRPIAVICSSGQRSGVAASLLIRHGATEVLHVVDGGVGTWAEQGWPVEEGAG
jgi:rhodanese-related sulfurtransferase